MYDNKTAIEEASKFIEAQPIREGGYPIEEIIPVVNWVNFRLDYERESGVGTQAEQLEWFEFLLGIGRDQRSGGGQSLGKLMLTAWAASSENLYAVAYHAGHSDGLISGKFQASRIAKNKAERVLERVKINAEFLSKMQVQRATDGRRLIGATSRAKVVQAAEAFRHQSKERAAASIADIVNLDPGTIRRYLSEAFPGKKWKQ